MALHMALMVNGEEIGYLHAQRRPRQQPPQGDDVCLYDWRLNIDGKTLANPEDAPLAHRFSDGAWVLVARVIAAAGHEPTDLDPQQEQAPPPLTGLAGAWTATSGR